MSKPELAEVLELLKMKSELKELTKLVASKTRKLIEEHGEGRFDYESADPKDDSKKFLKLTLKDELKALQQGEDVGRFVYYKNESSQVTYLLRRPKGL